MGSRRRVLPYIGIEKQPLCAHGNSKRGTVYLSVPLSVSVAVW